MPPLPAAPAKQTLRHRTHRRLLCAALLLCTAAPGLALAPSDTRVFELTYAAKLGPLPQGTGPVDVFLPLPVESEHQDVLELAVDSPIPGSILVERTHGNRYWHTRVTPGDESEFEIVLRTSVERRTFRGGTAVPHPLSSDERARYLAANERVVVNHEILAPILDEIRAKTPEGNPAERARAIYDWVVDNVEYKKVGKGWGNGDTFWACNERYGNCTDFHALFISLARSEGIPARFEIGFPIPEDRSEGRIGGYHCWVEFYLPGTGWFPIDASEAFKHPEKRDLFYGTHPADRVHFSTGRDLRLGDEHRGRALNYFIYPYLEASGRALKGPLETRFSYRERYRERTGNASLPAQKPAATASAQR